MNSSRIEELFSRESIIDSIPYTVVVGNYKGTSSDTMTQIVQVINTSPNKKRKFRFISENSILELSRKVDSIDINEDNGDNGDNGNGDNGDEKEIDKEDLYYNCIGLFDFSFSKKCLYDADIERGEIIKKRGIGIETGIGSKYKDIIDSDGTEDHKKNRKIQLTRKNLFPQFSSGRKTIPYYRVNMTTIGLFSVSPSEQNEYMISNLLSPDFLEDKKLYIFDGTSCVGGDVINTINYCSSINVPINMIANELDGLNYDCLVKNVKLFEYSDRVKCYNKDTIKFLFDDDEGDKLFKREYKSRDSVRPNVLYFDPPWGGKDYKNYASLDLYIGNMNMDTLVQSVLDKMSKFQCIDVIVLKVPYNFKGVDEGVISKDYISILGNDRETGNIRYHFINVRKWKIKNGQYERGDYERGEYERKSGGIDSHSESDVASQLAPPELFAEVKVRIEDFYSKECVVDRRDRIQRVKKTELESGNEIYNYGKTWIYKQYFVGVKNRHIIINNCHPRKLENDETRFYLFPSGEYYSTLYYIDRMLSEKFNASISIMSNELTKIYDNTAGCLFIIDVKKYDADRFIQLITSEEQCYLADCMLGLKTGEDNLFRKLNKHNIFHGNLNYVISQRDNEETRISVCYLEGSVTYGQRRDRNIEDLSIPSMIKSFSNFSV